MQYDKRLFIDLPVQYMKTISSEYVVYINYFECQNKNKQIRLLEFNFVLKINFLFCLGLYQFFKGSSNSWVFTFINLWRQISPLREYPVETICWHSLSNDFWKAKKIVNLTINHEFCFFFDFHQFVVRWNFLTRGTLFWFWSCRFLKGYPDWPSEV